MDKLKLYRALSPVLRPFGKIYASIMRKRREGYAAGEKEQYVPTIPCVSVGHIAWGGTGKTPVISWFLDWAKSRELKAVVLSRGYKAQLQDGPVLVDKDLSVEEAGDEPLLLARSHPEAKIVVFPKRDESAVFAEEYLEPDVLFLDDGMQHLAVTRDLDLVLLRPEDVGQEWDRVIPSGSWRESASALSAASAFAMKAEPEDRDALVPLIEKRLAPFSAPFFFFSLTPKRLRPLFQEKAESALKAREITGYILVSGVGNPAGVRTSALKFIGREPLEILEFPDHHQYTVQDVRRMAAASGRNGSAPILCTGKDAVKLAAFQSVLKDLPVFVLETAVEFGPPYFDRELLWQDWWESEWEMISRKKESERE